jgi:outer membrane lipoprotein-sorting protein
MTMRHRLAGAPAALLPLLLAGCSLFPTTRHLPVPKPPATVQTMTPQQLIDEINQRWDALSTLTATVEIQATELKTAEGLEKQFPGCRGFILLRKPKSLRVFGRVPVIGTELFDMASDANGFTLYIPFYKTVYKGSNTVTEKSPNPLMNLRPAFFLDAIMVQGVDPEDEFMVTNDTETMEDAAKKHLYDMPEYILNLMSHKNGNEYLERRVVRFHRDDMQPYGQEIYDNDGNLETQVSYSNYTNFTAGRYPSKVTIKRPQEGIQLVLSIERVEQPITLPADQFEVKIPEGAKVQILK